MTDCYYSYPLLPVAAELMIEVVVEEGWAWDEASGGWYSMVGQILMMRKGA